MGACECDDQQVHVTLYSMTLEQSGVPNRAQVLLSASAAVGVL